MIGQRASSTIRRAEADIRGLIAEAATAGEYDVVSRLSDIARRLSHLAEESDNSPRPPVEMPLPRIAAVEHRAAAKPVSSAASRTSRKEGYPRFERSRDTLVKIGWSKKERSEYVHKAPRAGLDAVTRRVMDLGRGGRMFTTEDLLPVKLGAEDDQLPGYQAYICLAWLRDIGAVEQHGREGYSVVGDDLVGTVNTVWESLPASRK